MERMWREGNSHTLLVGVQTGAATMENSMEIPQNLRIELPYDPVIPLLGIYPKNLKTPICKGTCTPVFIAALFTIAKTWKQPKCPSRDEWIKKLWYIYTMEYYSAIRNDEIQPFVTSWMDIEGIMQSEISQREKVKYRMISFVK